MVSTTTLTDHEHQGLAWREAGEPSAPLVLFLHGLGGSRTAWDTHLVALADAGFRTAAWDMPGYGASALARPLTFERVADDAARLLDLLGADRAHIVGLSFGGQQALHVALRHPGRVERLVLADTSSRFGADGTDAGEWKASRLASIDEGGTPAVIATAVIDGITGPAFGQDQATASERAMAIDAFKRIGVDGFRAAVECLPSHNVDAALGRVAAPTLVIVGELDEETPPAYAERLADGIPSAELVVIPGVGHLTPSEAPTQFATLVSNFLTRPSP